MYGGAIKNIGIGMGSKHGKCCTHSYAHPTKGIRACKVDYAKAIEASNSASCVRSANGNFLIPKTDPNETSVLDRMIHACSHDCFEIRDGQFMFHKERCTSCSSCFTTARFSGVFTMDPELPAMWPIAIADAAAGYMNAIGMDNFMFVNYAFDITPA